MLNFMVEPHHKRLKNLKTNHCFLFVTVYCPSLNRYNLILFFFLFSCFFLISVTIILFHDYVTALNEALKKEVERLKIATGEMMTPTDTYNLGMQHIPYSQLFYQHQPHPGPGDSQNMQMPQLHPFQPNTSGPHQSMLATAQSHAFSDMLQQDPLGRLQGLDINSRSSHLVKSEGPSISASESSSTF